MTLNFITIETNIGLYTKISSNIVNHSIVVMLV